MNALALVGLEANRQRGVNCGFAALWLFGSRRRALTLLEHCTAAFVLPNVRAKLRAEACSVSPVCDDG